MADILSLVKPEQLVEFAANYAYPTNFMGRKLFTPKKTNSLEVSIRQLIEGGNLPVMAQVHSFDAEARIGDRPNFEQVNYKKWLIKEKLNMTERVIEFLGSNASNDAVTNFVFDDSANLISRVITRTEVMNMELLSTGSVTVNENNISKTVVPYVPSSNKVEKSGWGTASHNILGDIQDVIDKAADKGYEIVRAITSTKVINYMMNNAAIKGYWEKKSDPLTKPRLLAWLNDNYGIEFVVNDAKYKTSLSSSTEKRFFNEDSICFLTTRGVLGSGLYGVTPEELVQPAPKNSEKLFVHLSQWYDPDSVATWTKASALYVPILADTKSVYIATISN